MTQKEEFEKDCKKFEELIKTGNSLTENAQSVRGGNLADAPKSEQKCFRWFIETRNFLSSLFGEGSMDIMSFRKCFGKYQSMNLMGMYSGNWSFVKEDMHRGVGVLEGIYDSYKNGLTKRKEELVQELIKTPDRIRVMLDNDVLNKLADGEINLEKIKSSNKFEFYATHIQTDQASRCKDEDKRARLSLFLTSIKPNVIATESFILGKSRWGFAKFSDEKELEELRQGNMNHTEDALIGETAIKNRILLITNDKTLKSRVNVNGGRAINLEEFKDILE